MMPEFVGISKERFSMAKLGNQQRVLVDEKCSIGFHQLASMESAASVLISLH